MQPGFFPGYFFCIKFWASGKKNKRKWKCAIIYIVIDKADGQKKEKKRVYHNNRYNSNIRYNK